MAKYRVYLEATSSTTVEVEADSKEEAVELAFQGDLPYACHQCPELSEWEFPPDVYGSHYKTEDYVEELEA